jgi:hypothetical protein
MELTNGKIKDEKKGRKTIWRIRSCKRDGRRIRNNLVQEKGHAEEEKWKINYEELGSSISIVCNCRVKNGVRSLTDAKYFPLASVSRAALRPAHPPVQWVPRVLSPGVKRDLGVTLTTHPHLVPSSRMNMSYITLPLGACMVVAGRL